MSGVGAASKVGFRPPSPRRLRPYAAWQCARSTSTGVNEEQLSRAYPPRLVRPAGSGIAVCRSERTAPRALGALARRGRPWEGRGPVEALRAAT